VRLFGGWDFKDDVLNQSDWVADTRTACRWADLPAKMATRSFIVYTKDPEDGNLDRISRQRVDQSGTDLREGI
jgi:hypothetical protein